MGWLWIKPVKSWSTPLNFAISTLILNLLLSLLFGCVYFIIDNNFNTSGGSLLRGIEPEQMKYFGSYIYFSVIITSTLGLGEIVPSNSKKPASIMRFIVCLHIMTVIFMNDFLDSVENMLLS